jgi:hypothetical protein
MNPKVREVLENDTLYPYLPASHSEKERCTTSIHVAKQSAGEPQWQQGLQVHGGLRL